MNDLDVTEVKKGDMFLLVPNDHVVVILGIVKNNNLIAGFDTKLTLSDNRQFEKYMSVDDYDAIKKQLFKI